MGSEDDSRDKLFPYPDIKVGDLVIDLEHPRWGTAEVIRFEYNELAESSGYLCPGFAILRYPNGRQSGAHVSTLKRAEP